MDGLTLKGKEYLRDNFLIDLECVICQEIPQESARSQLHIFSCSQAHLLCQECSDKVRQCPVCKESFLHERPGRNPLAERLASSKAVLRKTLDVLKSGIDWYKVNSDWDFRYKPEGIHWHLALIISQLVSLEMVSFWKPADNYNLPGKSKCSSKK